MNIVQREIVIEKKTGKVRQSGADSSGAWLAQMREGFEKDLYFFGFGVLGLTRMTETLHKPVCDWLIRVPKSAEELGFRKALLMPRDHLKTSIMRALTCHIFLQPKESNLYFPGKEGSEVRILYAGETSTNAEHQLSWIESIFEKNPLVRALWPHRVWENSRRDSKRWNSQEMLLPRSEEFPEASVETIGVGGAVTGRHYDMLIKDDLVSLAAANSPQIMSDALLWHKASRALLDDPEKGLEFIIGTHWAMGDIYCDMRKNDPTLDIVVRAAIENGKPIFPEMFSLESLAKLRQSLGPLFSLIYMNNPIDAGIVDFDMGQVRRWGTSPEGLSFPEDPRDAKLREMLQIAGGGDDLKRGDRLSLDDLRKLGRAGSGRVSIV